MDWLWGFILHPMNYGIPQVDAWIKEWGNWINLFVVTNPWFCTFMSGTGMTWFTWFVMHTPWNWDNKWPEWVKVHIFKQNPTPDPPAPGTSKEAAILLTEVVEEGKTLEQQQKEQREVLARLDKEIQKQATKTEEVKP